MTHPGSTVHDSSKGFKLGSHIIEVVTDTLGEVMGLTKIVTIKHLNHIEESKPEAEGSRMEHALDTKALETPEQHALDTKALETSNYLHAEDDLKAGQTDSSGNIITVESASAVDLSSDTKQLTSINHKPFKTDNTKILKKI